MKRLIIIAVVIAMTSQGSLASGGVQYNRDVLPILAKHCFTWHRMDAATRKASLRLDIANNKAINTKRPPQSPLLERIFSQDPLSQMPPANSQHSLTAKEKSILRAWVKQGAEYESHWSFIWITRKVSTRKFAEIHLMTWRYSMPHPL